MSAPAGRAPASSRLPARRRVPWPRRFRQRFLCCWVCGGGELCSAGLCRSCYDAAHHSETNFGGHKEAVLARDGRRCRVCRTGTDIVHHRQPGCHDPAGLLALCAACHATVHRLQALDRYLPPLLLVLWREQHPAAPAGQLQFGWDEGRPA